MTYPKDVWLAPSSLESTHHEIWGTKLDCADNEWPRYGLTKPCPQCTTTKRNPENWGCQKYKCKNGRVLA